MPSSSSSRAKRRPTTTAAGEALSPPLRQLRLRLLRLRLLRLCGQPRARRPAVESHVSFCPRVAPDALRASRASGQGQANRPGAAASEWCAPPSRECRSGMVCRECQLLLSVCSNGVSVVGLGAKGVAFGCAYFNTLYRVSVSSCVGCAVYSVRPRAQPVPVPRRPFPVAPFLFPVGCWRGWLLWLWLRGAAPLPLWRAPTFSFLVLSSLFLLPQTRATRCANAHAVMVKP